MELKGTFILKGNSKGELLVTKEAISFWGCVDPVTGIISDKRHELYKSCVAGKILVFPYGKGSSTGSLMILELIRNNMAPAAIINIRTEPLLTTGPVVGKHFYKKYFPILTIEEDSFNHLKTGQYASISGDGKAATIIISDNDG
jgi:predicted aconitase with swiveling domain